MAYQLDSFIDIGREIFRQTDYARMFNFVINETTKAMDAEGGTLYLYDENGHALEAVVVANKVLNIEHAISEFNPSRIRGLFKVKLNDDQQIPEKSISGSCFRTKQRIFVKDVATETEHDVSSQIKFDRENNYQTKSLITFPLLSRNREVLGVVQLVNPDPKKTSSPEIDVIMLFVSFMSMALENRLLLLNSQNLLQATIEMISSAIDEKSTSTAGHCYRVTELTMMLANEMAADQTGPYRDFTPTKEELDELRVAALLHDVGKIATSDFVLEKKRKLETVVDNIEAIRLRMKLRRSMIRVTQLEQAIQNGHMDLPAEEAHNDESDMRLLEQLNTGGESVTAPILERLRQIADLKYGDKVVLEEQDVVNLSIQRGTLNSEERKIMEEHASISIRLLSKLPWPSELSEVCEIAGKHHENCDGSGYPLQLTAKQMSLRARILSLTDRFEGLIAQDRTYRKPKTLDQVMKIMGFFSSEGKIDSQLFDFFVSRGVHNQFYKKFIATKESKLPS